MDILAHALWTNLAYYKKYKTSLSSRLWAVFFGILPDLISFIPATVYLLFFRDRTATIFVEFAKNLWVFRWAVESYNYTHSLVIFSGILVIVLILRKGRMYWPLLGWPFHICIDIFTHKNFFETPFLFPFSNLRNHNYSIPWSEPYFMLVNYLALAAFYAIIFFILRRKKHGQE